MDNFDEPIILKCFEALSKPAHRRESGAPPSSPCFWFDLGLLLFYFFLTGFFSLSFERIKKNASRPSTLGFVPFVPHASANFPMAFRYAKYLSAGDAPRGCLYPNAARAIDLYRPDRDCFASTLTSLDESFQQKWETVGTRSAMAISSSRLWLPTARFILAIPMVWPSSG